VERPLRAFVFRQRYFGARISEDLSGFPFGRAGRSPLGHSIAHLLLLRSQEVLAQSGAHIMTANLGGRFSSGGTVPEAGIRCLTKPLVPGIVRFVNVTDGNSPGLLFREQLDGVEPQPRSRGGTPINGPSQNRQRWLALGACMTGSISGVTARRNGKLGAMASPKPPSPRRTDCKLLVIKDEYGQMARATKLSSCWCMRPLIV
jgi:hypothetical protein